MKYISGAIGAILLIYLLSLDRISVFGNVCYIAGSKKTGELWGSDVNEPVCINPGIYYTGIMLACALMIIALLLVIRDMLEANSNHNLSLRTTYSPPSSKSTATISTNTASDEISSTSSPAWKTLKEFDPSIQAAINEISSFGPAAEERLATAYLAVSEKSLLPAIVAKITADEAEVAAKEARIATKEKEAKEKYDADQARKILELSKKDKEMIADRVLRAHETIATVKEHGMALNGKKVVSAEMYYGDDIHNQGWAKIIYEDGLVELRAGSSFIRKIGTS